MPANEKQNVQINTFVEGVRQLLQKGLRDQLVQELNDDGPRVISCDDSRYAIFHAVDGVLRIDRYDARGMRVQRWAL